MTDKKYKMLKSKSGYANYPDTFKAIFSQVPEVLFRKK